MFVYDLSEVPEPEDGMKFCQKYVDKLKYVGVGQSAGGFTLDWNPNKYNELITGTDDGGIYLYDFNSPKVGQMPYSILSSPCSSARAVKFNHMYSHADEHAVNTVSWSHDISGNIFGSGGDDGCICLWDKRSAAVSSKFLSKDLAGNPVGEVRSLSFCPSDPNLFASGDDSGLARVWDCRMQRFSILALCHRRMNLSSISLSGSVVSEVNWIPGSPCLLSTTVSFSGKDLLKKDKEVTMSEQCMWDLSLVEGAAGGEDSDEMASDPLLFSHHNPSNADITDASISSGPRNLVANVDSENMLGIWRMADQLR